MRASLICCRVACSRRRNNPVGHVHVPYAVKVFRSGLTYQVDCFCIIAVGRSTPTDCTGSRRRADRGAKGLGDCMASLQRDELSRRPARGHADLNAPPASCGLHRCICASDTTYQLGGRKDSQ